MPNPITCAVETHQRHDGVRAELRYFLVRFNPDRTRLPIYLVHGAILGSDSDNMPLRIGVIEPGYRHDGIRIELDGRSS